MTKSHKKVKYNTASVCQLHGFLSIVCRIIRIIRIGNTNKLFIFRRKKEKIWLFFVTRRISNDLFFGPNEMRKKSRCNNANYIRPIITH